MGQYTPSNGQDIRKPVTANGGLRATSNRRPVFDTYANMLQKPSLNTTSVTPINHYIG